MSNANPNAKPAERVQPARAQAPVRTPSKLPVKPPRRYGRFDDVF
jgi:hypothetical protein